MVNSRPNSVDPWGYSRSNGTFLNILDIPSHSW